MIEKASLEHIDILVSSGREVLADLPNYAGVPFDEEHSKNALTMYLSLPIFGCFFKRVDNKVVGVLMGVVGAPWFTPQNEMSEIIFWVHRDYRRTGISRELIKAMEHWAVNELNAKKLLMAAGSGYETERITKFYNKLGYRTWGTSTCKEIK